MNYTYNYFKLFLLSLKISVLEFTTIINFIKSNAHLRSITRIKYTRVTVKIKNTRNKR